MTSVIETKDPRRMTKAELVAEVRQGLVWAASDPWGWRREELVEEVESLRRMRQ